MKNTEVKIMIDMEIERKRKNLLEDIIRILSRASFEQLRKIYIVALNLKI